ncbi:MAG: c-type cytochrome [Candidatus Tectomicrobia bacterium]|uniref:C-type cytochrome n=1 Tax=Tectimicrobiota bacterium TaxID=2528274 RepID=A0A932LZT3_UNCTE|nr:c-type cytochrome [Candidatus Tectomicrobia bacterium]
MKPLDRFANRDFVWLFAISILFFALVAAAVGREYSTDWREIQTKYRKMLAAKKGETAVKNFQIDAKQLWIPRLGRVDRCVACHLSYEETASVPSDLPEPFKPHPALAYLEPHRFPNFGCTTCHGGQGFATRTRDAHGTVEHWEDPLITRELAQRYGLTRRELMEAKCNSCHRQDPETRGMDLINMAKRQISQRGCTGCHAMDGKGGNAGPDLTYAGDKNPELLDFSNVEGEKTALNWHVQHFKDPQKVVPGSIMPNLGIPDREAKALALLMMSWRKENFSPEYVSRPRPAAAKVIPAAAQAPFPPLNPQASEAAKRGRETFQNKGCRTCHSVGGGRIIGPDLLGVSRKRSKEWLRAWLGDPAAFIRSHPELKSWPDEFGGVVMPNQNLSSEEISALVEFLGTL